MSPCDTFLGKKVSQGVGKGAEKCHRGVGGFQKVSLLGLGVLERFHNDVG